MGKDCCSGGACAPKKVNPLPKQAAGDCCSGGTCAPKAVNPIPKQAAGDCCSGGTCAPKAVNPIPKQAAGDCCSGGTCAPKAVNPLPKQAAGDCCSGGTCAPKNKSNPSSTHNHTHSQPSVNSQAKGGCCSGGSCSRPSNAPSLNDLLKSTNPEEVKDFGNVLYKQGKFVESLQLYERAIALDPTKAAYQSNKAAALTGLNRINEAISACEVALNLDSNYSRASQRLAKLCIRIGDFDKACNAAGKLDASEARESSDLIDKIVNEITNNEELTAKEDWNAVLKSVEAIESLGTDSYPKVLLSKTKALLGLHKPDLADASLQYAKKLIPSTDIDSNFALISIDIDLALGRFESAVSDAEASLQTHPDNVQISNALIKGRSLLENRNKGNQCFKQQQYAKAIECYSEGLKLDVTNAVLLCNRAACFGKEEDWKAALEDCESALKAYPSFTKAILRRANCFSHLERWQEAVNDYKSLLKAVGDDYEITKMYIESKMNLRKDHHQKSSKYHDHDHDHHHHHEHDHDHDHHHHHEHDHVIEINNSKLFHHILSLTEYVLADFYANWCGPCKQIAPTFLKWSQRFLNVQFVKVNVDVVQDLASAENVSSIPTFKLFKNGKLIKEVQGANASELESSLLTIPN